MKEEYTNKYTEQMTDREKCSIFMYPDYIIKK